MTGKYLMPLMFLISVSACSVAPEGTSQDDVTDFIAAAATIGCVLKYDSDYAPIEFQAGLTRQQVLDISGFLVARGDAQSLPEGGVRITSGACAQA